MPFLELRRTAQYALFHDTEEAWLYMNWVGYQTPATVMNGCNDMLRAMHERAVFYIVNNNTNVTGSWSGAAQWCATEWLPLAQKAGMKAFAWVQGTNTLSQQSSHTTLALVKPEEYGIQVFYDIESAEVWLRRQRQAEADRATKKLDHG